MKFMIVMASIVVGTLAQAANHPVQQYASADDPNRKPKTVREKAKECPFQHRGAQKLSLGGATASVTPTETRVNR